MPSTATRRDVVKALLDEHDVESQAQLIELLARRGFAVSQPALSRDLRALRVAKQAGVYRIPDVETVTPLVTLRSLLRSAAPVTHTIAVRCEPGAASAVARALEAEDIEGFEGTVAGDDTVLVFVSSKAAGERVQTRVAELVRGSAA